MAEEQLRTDALEYHEHPTPGKISIAPTKALANQRDLSLAYSPGVAYACTAIQEDPRLAARYTARGNLVAVITNGSAVLGLGNIGALAGKPVMEGKSCLCKKFAGIDVFDIEIGESDPDKIVDVVAALGPTFGGINLEDIKAPECFYIERKLRERMKIPVFHDDQHGTAIVAAAAVLNALQIVGKDISRVKLVCSGAGAAALACLNLQVSLGLRPGNIWVTDSKGVVYKGRVEAMDPDKARYAQETKARTLDEIIDGADVFLGLSAGGVLTAKIVAQAYGEPTPAFGPDYLIPRAFDPRLITNIAPAVAKAAMESGVASRPIQDFQAYRDQLGRFVYQSGTTMEPVFAAAKRAPKRVVYAEGEDERVLRAAQAAVDEGIVRPVFVGRADIVAARIAKLGLRLKLGDNCEVVNILDDPRYRETWLDYYQLARRKGVSKAQAQEEIRSRPTLIAAMLVRRGDADAMLCGTHGDYADHLRYVRMVIGLRDGARTFAAMQMLILPGRQLFICDTHVNRDPNSLEIAEMTLLAAEELKRFGVKPSVALVSHSSFGSSDAPSAQKMRDALAIILDRAPGLSIEGEMRADSALDSTIRDNEFPDSRLTADANLLIMPNVDAANITYNALRVTAGGGITVGGILLGAAKSVHIMTPSSTVPRIANMTALAVAEAGAQREKQWKTD